VSNPHYKNKKELMISKIKKLGVAIGTLALAYVVSPAYSFAQSFSTSTNSQDELLNEVSTNAGDRLLHVLFVLIPLGLAFWGIYYVWRHGWGFLFGRTH